MRHFQRGLWFAVNQSTLSKSVITLVAAGLVSACTATQPFGPNFTGSIQTPTTVDAKFIPGLPKGYQCPIVPNGFDPAGSIFSVDKNGTYFRVKDYSSDPVVQRGHKKDVQIANYVLSDQQKSTAGLSATLLKKALPGVGVNANLNSKQELAIDVTVEDLRGDIIYQDTADYIVRRFSENFKPKRGTRYYLVRETVRAGAVSYGLKREDLKKIAGEAKVKQIAEGKADVTIRDNAGVLQIRQTFTPRIHVCIKSSEIVIEQPRNRRDSQPAKIELKPAEDTRVPTIKKVGA